ncbi:MAG TPA: hypothetical protein VLD66_05450 [Methyloceanibacter sp.]|nr:hypothetical protein [Methyloceanibacter sp.]
MLINPTPAALHVGAGSGRSCSISRRGLPAVDHRHRRRNGSYSGILVIEVTHYARLRVMLIAASVISGEKKIIAPWRACAGAEEDCRQVGAERERQPSGFDHCIA